MDKTTQPAQQDLTAGADQAAAEQAAAEQAAADKAAADKANAKKTKARVLVDGAWGRINDVVLLSAAEVKAAAGDVDTDRAAVAYAESLQG